MIFDKLDMILWVAWIYGFITSLVLIPLGYGFPFNSLGYIPWLVAISLIIQRNAYE